MKEEGKQVEDSILLIFRTTDASRVKKTLVQAAAIIDAL